MQGFSLFPDQASTFAGPTDLLYLVLLCLSLLFAGVLPFVVLYLVVHYHRSQQVDRTNPPASDLRLELTWTIIPLILAMGVFFWGAFLYVQMRTPPAQAIDIYVIGKQWMWHTQHSNGKRENNELHVPIGRPVRLIMTSQDVIHSFYVPAFRVKQDVLPGRYTTLWFEATLVGQYHLFCAEYCGTEHSLMGGTVTVMSMSDYQAWLSTPGQVIMPDGTIQAGTVLVNTNGIPSKPTTASSLSDPMALAGEKLFTSLGCVTCHVMAGGGLGPSLKNVFGFDQLLVDGSMAKADENYISESILRSTAKVVKGYAAVMPPYQGQLSNDQVNQLLAYVKSLSTRGGATPSPTPTATSGGSTGGPFNADLAAKGKTLFTSIGCVGCHLDNGTGLGPSLKSVYNSTVTLADDSTVKADDAYLHESIVNSTAKVVKGYTMIMPVFKSQLKADEVAALIEYIKFLGSAGN